MESYEQVVDAPQQRDAFTPSVITTATTAWREATSPPFPAEVMAPLLQALDAHVFHIEPRGHILSYSGPGGFAKPVDELVGDPMFTLVPPAAQETLKDAMERARTTRIVQIVEHTIPFDLGYFRTEDRITCLDDGSFLLVSGNVTTRYNLNHMLRTKEEHLRVVVSTAPIVLFAYDRDGVYTMCEGQGLYASGGIPGEDVGKSIFKVHQNSPSILFNTRRALAGETFMGINETGGRIFETHYIPRRDSTGAIVGAVGFGTDVTERHRTTAALQETERRFHVVVTNAPSLLFALDQDGVVTMIEGQERDVLGAHAAALVGRSIFDLSVKAPPLLIDSFQASAGMRPGDDPLTYCTKIGDSVFETRLSVIGSAEGKGRSLIGVSSNVSILVKSEEARLAVEGRFRALSEYASDLVLIIDPRGTYRYASPSHLHVLGYDAHLFLGANSTSFIHPDDRQRIRDEFMAGIMRNEHQVETIARLRHADGSWRTFEFVGSNHLDDPYVQGIIINAHDVTARLAAEETLMYRSHHDTLTGLPNRKYLHSVVDTMLDDRSEDMCVALLLIDLDRFKDVNDTLGHHYGDMLLQAVGQRLTTAVRAGDIVARLGGDEFAILLSATDVDGARAVAATLLDDLNTPFPVGDHKLDIDASIGIALAPLHGEDFTTLFRCADVAMYEAKNVRGGAALYDLAVDRRNTERLNLASELRYAIEQDDLILHYQPTVSFATGCVTGVEALVRWRHAVRGLIPPDEFIGLAEYTGLIGPLTIWVLHEALRQASLWRRDGLNLRVAVNLSMRSLNDPDLADTIAALAAAHNVPVDVLTLEVTENALMADPARVQDVLLRLGAKGIRIAIDDFGAGYSSLAYLQRLPAHTLKIDKSFIMTLGQTADPASIAIVSAVIAMARALGRDVVAEGIESVDAWEVLRDLGCDVGQGYYMSKPLPAVDLERWLASSPWGVGRTAVSRRVSA